MSRTGPCECPRRRPALPRETPARDGPTRFAVGRGVGTLGLACGVALIPKCPACLAAYLWFFSMAGLSAIRGARWMGPALMTLLAVGVVATSLRARQRHGYGPCLVGLVATTA